MYTMEMKIQDEIWAAEIQTIIKTDIKHRIPFEDIVADLMSEFNIKESEAKSLIEEYNKNSEE